MHRSSPWPGLVAALLLGGCGVASSPPRTVEAPPPTLASEPPPLAAEAPAPKVVDAPSPTPPRAATPAAPSKPAAAPSKPATAPKTAPKAEARAAPAVASAASVAPKASASAEARPTTPPLDLKSLEQRLKETGAIGVLTKLSLKNQVDDLVARFRAFHAGQRPPTITELRPSFDLLLMKVLSLIQDKDAALAKDIDASRNAIWNLLTDREKLARHT